MANHVSFQVLCEDRSSNTTSINMLNFDCWLLIGCWLPVGWLVAGWLGGGCWLVIGGCGTLVALEWPCPLFSKCPIPVKPILLWGYLFMTLPAAVQTQLPQVPYCLTARLSLLQTHQVYFRRWVSLLYVGYIEAIFNARIFLANKNEPSLPHRESSPPLGVRICPSSSRRPQWRNQHRSRPQTGNDESLVMLVKPLWASPLWLSRMVNQCWTRFWGQLVLKWWLMIDWFMKSSWINDQSMVEKRPISGNHDRYIYNYHYWLMMISG